MYILAFLFLLEFLAWLYLLKRLKHNQKVTKEDIENYNKKKHHDV